ncbi:MAG: HesA/MoeB/ThiF family protein [Bacteroidales bacterium]
MERYSRHILLKEIGEEGQQKLLKASVLIIGAGGLGSPIALYLAAAGVGRIGIIDDDVVSLTNLQRQILYRESQIGTPKVACAKATLNDLNSETDIRTYPFRLDDSNARSIIKEYDLIIDACDNFDTRYLTDRITQKYGVPYLYGSIGEFTGQVSVFNIAGAGSYADLFPEDEKPEKGTLPLGVMGSVPGVIGSIQATEAIKLITGIGKPLINELLCIDLLNMEFRKIKLG